MSGFHLPANVDWSLLSPEGRETLEQVALPRAEEGVSFEELAERLGRSPGALRRAMKRLGDELIAKAGSDRMPPLSAEEFATLKADIAARGVLVPILVAATGEIIDGHHRARACADLGIECPRIVIEANEDERRTLGRALNLARRHLSQAQRRALVASELRREPSRSDLAIAQLIGVSSNTVKAVRSSLVREGDIRDLQIRRDTLGRQRPARYEREDDPDSTDFPIKLVIEAPRVHVDRWRRAARSAGLELQDWAVAKLDEASAD